MRSLKHTQPVRFKAGTIAEDGTFEGYGSIANFVDSGGDMVAPGAFAESLARHAANGTAVKLLWQHCPDDPIGVWLEMREDERGLWCKGKLLQDVQKGREAYALMKAGAVDGLSIGYECHEWEHASPADIGQKYGVYPGGVAYSGGDHVRVLKTIDLWEVSVVTFPMNEAARIEAVKQRPRAIDLSPLAAAFARREKLFA